MAVQELMDVDPEGTIEKLKEWLDERNYLVYRALAAGLAEPRLMKNRVLELQLKNERKSPGC